MECDGSSEKDISVALEKLSITSSDQTSSQTKNNSENPPPLQSQKYCQQYIRLEKVKIVLDVKVITKKINKTSGTSFNEDYIAINTSQLLDKKIIKC